MWNKIISLLDEISYRSLVAKEPVSPPKLKLALKDDETIINPFYMQQLLKYAIKCAKEGRELSDEDELIEAQVSNGFVSSAATGCDHLTMILSSVSFKS